MTYKIDEPEFMHAARAYWSYRGIGDRGSWILAALCLVAGGALLYKAMPVGSFFIGAAALFVAITVLRNVLWRRGYHKMVKYSAPIEASFDAENVHTNSAEGQSTLPWTSFTKYAETPEYFFLMRPRGGLSILPKRACPDEWQLDTLREHIITNLPRSKMRWT